MAKILAVGIATLDIINVVDAYPAEDSEVRAIEQKKVRGGNATNTLVVLSQLGHNCHWAGVLVQEPDSTVINQELERYAISTLDCIKPTSGKIPTSYISLNNKTGSRSIVHYRDCPEYDFDAFQKIDLTEFDWLHFEGRNIEQTRLMLDYAQKHYPHIPRSLEVEKPRNGIEDLFTLASLLFFSKDYVMSQGFNCPTEFLQQLAIKADTLASCTWGHDGAWLKDNAANINHYQASSPMNVVDTLAAGDTFNAGMIHSLVSQKNELQALKFACTLASNKCQQFGLHNLLDHFEISSNTP